MGSEIMSPPSEYFKSYLGKVLVNSLVRCASKKPKDPIDYLSYELERCSCSNERMQLRRTKAQPQEASLYFRNTFGSSLKQALFEAILMKPENPIAAVSGRQEKTHVDALRSKSSRLTRFYRQTAPVITDIRSLTSKGLLNRKVYCFPFLLLDNRIKNGWKESFCEE